MHPTACRIQILPSSRKFGFLYLIIHVRYVKGQMMLIKCFFVIIVIMDTIYSTSSQSSLKFPPTFGIVHHVLLQHLDFYLTMPRFSRLKFGGGYMRISSQPPLVHCIYMCMHLFLVDQFLPLTSFSLFVYQSLLWIYTLITPYVTTLHVTTLQLEIVSNQVNAPLLIKSFPKIPRAWQ